MNTGLLGLLAVGGVIAIVMLLRLFKNWYGLLVVLLFALACISRVPIYFPEKAYRGDVSDIARASPSLSMLAIALVVEFLIARSSKSGYRITSVDVSWLAFASLLLAMTWLSWGSGLDVWAGNVLFFVSILGWFVGRRLGIGVLRSNHESLRVVYAGLCLIMFVQAVFSIRQVVTHSTGDGRAIGTFDHPSLPGKYLLLTLPLLLPGSVSGDKKSRVLSNCALVFGFVALGLSQSRANLIAVVGVLLAWAFVFRRPTHDGRLGFLSRLRWPIILVLGVLPFVNSILDRFAEDPDGGQRGPLLDAAADMIHIVGWGGTGPNNYVMTAKQFEIIVAQTGYPVHNSFFLGFLELGAIGVGLFSLLILATVVVAFRRRNSEVSMTANSARSYLVTLFGVLVIGYSSWGLWQDPVLPLGLFIAGFVFSLCEENSAHRVGDSRLFNRDLTLRPDPRQVHDVQNSTQIS